MNIDEILEKIDTYFAENRGADAETLMLESLRQAQEEGNQGARLQLLNELMGYYRETSQNEKLNDVVETTLQLADSMDIADSVPYATTTLNAANAYRAMGNTEKSLKYYRITEEIYRKTLAADDMLMAGLYNNLSLLYQEMEEYVHAQEQLQKALEIVQKNNAEFEIAVTYANLANTCVAAENYENAEGYAQKAIGCFKKIDVFDVHYCAALSALGMCNYYKKEFAKAEQLFSEGMEIILRSLGKNMQYERMKANRDACREAMGKTHETAEMTGLELCRRYYETYGIPMIREHFPEYEKKIAAGLVGEGSDCMGYDDQTSMDHDWGPDFCLWVTEETYQQIGKQLQEEYEKLPDTFLGYHRTKSAQGLGRRGVMTICGFYKRILGAARYEDLDWRTVEDYALASAVNGEIFRDDEGIFSEFRDKLKRGYPQTIRFQKLAEDVAVFSQTGQYNYFRMYERGDKLTADRMLSDCIGSAMKLQHHICNVYPPHDKWLHRSMMDLKNGEVLELVVLLEALHRCINGEKSPEDVKEITESIGSFFAQELYAANDISDVDSYLDMHTGELLEKARDAALDDEDLVDEIVKIEFEAFDKVKNEGGRAYCQNDWPTFSVMRKSQYLTWNRTMLLQYLYDFKREYSRGHNLITEKYGRMMESTAPEKYQELKQYFPEIPKEKKEIIEQIVEIQMEMMETFAEQYPKVTQNARTLHTYEDNLADTSYETYLRGEISTYSDKMLQLYGQYVVQALNDNRNIALQTIENTARLYGYENIEEFEASV
jgi:tetratricopeptide (TPR) repeat protein